MKPLFGVAETKVSQQTRSLRYARFSGGFLGSSCLARQAFVRPFLFGEEDL
jgi:hypothetical protein